MNALELEQWLNDHPGWLAAETPTKLVKDFVFSDFNATFGFMTQVALLAEKQNHHPVMINDYRRLTLKLVSHDVGRITDRDFKFAIAVEAILASYKSK